MTEAFENLVDESPASIITIESTLSYLNTTADIIVNIIVIIAGVVGLLYVFKFREKQRDSIFSYQSRLMVRLKFFDEMLTKYEREIKECFYNKSNRREISADRVALIGNVIKHISEYAHDTIQFLCDENDQMPADIGWSQSINTFIEFLIDCEQLTEPGYFKWIKDDEGIEKCNDYYINMKNNIKKLSNMIIESQVKVENKIFKETFLGKVKKWFSGI
jgi:hypothetical protein